MAAGVFSARARTDGMRLPRCPTHWQGAVCLCTCWWHGYVAPAAHPSKSVCHAFLRGRTDCKFHEARQRCQLHPLRAAAARPQVAGARYASMEHSTYHGSK